MAANIERKFGLRPELIEGNNGIFEVQVNGSPVWDNQSKCTHIPTEAEVMSIIKRYVDPLPGEEIKEVVVFPLFLRGKQEQ